MDNSKGDCPSGSVTVVRKRNPLSNVDDISIPELNFHGSVTSPSGKNKMIELPCPKCLNITLFFVIETKYGNRLLNQGTRFLNFFCTICDYYGQSKQGWEQFDKMDLKRTTLDFIKRLNDADRAKMISNLKGKFNL